MPSGRTHTVANSYLAILAVSFIHPLEYALLVASGCFLGIFLSPDLDVDRGHFGFYFLEILFGKWFSFIWKWYWKPYSLLVPHRNWVSHFPIVSTFFRFLYLFLPFLVIFRVITPSYLPISWEKWLIPVFLGTVAADSLHFFMDILSTSIKRKLR